MRIIIHAETLSANRKPDYGVAEETFTINRLVENEIKTLPDNFLEYHQQQRSPYDGTFSEIFETAEYP